MDEMDKHIDKIKKALVLAVIKNMKDQKTGVLFSGGVDSSTIALILKQNRCDFICYTAGVKAGRLERARDAEAAEYAAEKHGFKLNITEEELEMVEKDIKDVMKIIKSHNVIKVGVGLAMYVAMREAKKDGVKLMYSGIGSEEIFAGYERHRKASDISEECRKGLDEIKKRDLERDYAIAGHFGIDLVMPFLDDDLVRTALKVPGNMKIRGNENKYILRKTAEVLGLDKKIAYRKKLGAQYGSKFDRAISWLAKRSGYHKKSEYLNQLVPD